MIKVNTGTSSDGTRSRSQIIALFIALIVFIVLLFANFAYLNTQASYETWAAIQRSLSLSGRASPRPPAARLPRVSPWAGMRARQ